MYILPLESVIDLGNIASLDPVEFESNVEQACEASKNVLVNQWLPECADVFLELKQHWRKLVPRKPDQSCDLVEKFFSCVNMLMSLQLRSLVMRSLDHFKQLVVAYKVSFYNYKEVVSICASPNSVTINVLSTNHCSNIIGRQWLWRRVSRFGAN